MTIKEELTTKLHITIDARIFRRSSILAIQFFHVILSFIAVLWDITIHLIKIHEIITKSRKSG